MFYALYRALTEIFTRPFWRVMFKSLGFAAVFLVYGLVGLQALATWLIDLPGPAWLDTALSLLLAVGLLIGMLFLIAPFTALFAAFFADEIAAVVEAVDYPADPPGRELPFAATVATAMRFTAVVVVVNVVLLLLVFVLPGINLAALFLANGYLIGREFFELAAARHLPPDAARRFRRDHRFTVLATGVVVACFMAVPFLNLATPLFAAATMMHLFKRLSGGRAAEPRPRA
jgi:CysZ protein